MTTITPSVPDYQYQSRPCKSCGALVVWLRHERTGNPAPIDAAPSPVGNIVISPATGIYSIVPAADRARYAGELHTNHFQTCPQSKQWRRK